MDDGFYQWLNSGAAAPHLQRLGVSGGMIQQQQNPYNDYQSELIGWMQANPDNPKLQNSLTEMYLDSREPSYDREFAYKERADNLNLALSLMELGQEDMAMEILGGYGFGAQPEEQAQMNMSQFGYPSTTSASAGGSNLGGYQAQSLQNRYGTMSETETDPNRLALYDLLSSGDPSVTSKYYEDIGPWERQREMDLWQYFVPFGLGGLFQTKDKTREDRIKRAYGL